MPSVTGTSSLQYQQFVSFASAEGVKGGTILASQNDQNGGLEIVAKTKGDFYGHIARSKDTKNANNAIRNAFRQSIVDMFGVANADQLPPSVKKAMCLNDYDKGKPLTARRILSVKAAVDKQLNSLTEAAQKSFDQCEATFDYMIRHDDSGAMAGFKVPHFKVDDTVKGLLATALKACKGDAEAYELVRANIFSVIIGNDEDDHNRLRLETDDQVTRNVGRILDNLNKLRQLTGNDTKMYNAMKPYVGKSDITPEKLDCIVEAFNYLDLSGLQHLTPSASPKDIHEAAKKFDECLDEAMTHSGVSDSWLRWDENNAKQMFASMIFTKVLPGGDGASKLRSALETKSASRLMKYYDVMKSDAPTAIEFARGANKPRLEQLKGLLDIFCDGPENPTLRPIKEFNGPVTADDIEPDLKNLILASD